MSEAQLGGFQPETGSDFFSIEGDGRRFFLDEGEKLTENPEGLKEFGGFINFRDTNGNEQKFPGRVADGGDHWLVQNYGPDGEPEYIIPKAGVVQEAGKIAAEGIIPAAEIAPVGGLEDAAAVVAMEAMPAVPTMPAEVAAPAPEAAAAVELPAPAPEPEAAPVVELAGTPEKASKENRHPLIVELQQKMQGVSRPLRAVRLWRQSEGAIAQAENSRSKAKIKQFFARKRELEDQAKELFPGIEKMADVEREELSRKIVPLSAEGVTEAIRISSPRHREDMAVFYETELQKWENILRDPDDFWQYRAEREKVESQKSAARQLFPEKSDKSLLDQAIIRIEQRGSGRQRELEGHLPQRLLELAGFIQNALPTLGQAESDMDLRLAYNRAAQQLYTELAGQPQAVDEAVTVSMSEEAPQPETEQMPAAMEESPAEVDLPITSEGEAVPAVAEAEGAPVVMEENPALAPAAAETETVLDPIKAPVEEQVEPPAEAGAPVGGLTGYQLLEGQQKDGRLLGRFRAPDGQVWEGIAEVGPDGKATIRGALAEEEVAPPPMEAPVEAPMPGGVVVDAAEQARAAAAMPADAAEMDEHFFGQTAEEIEAEKVRQRAELAAQTVPMPEATAETPEQRAERRKQGFAGAFAELDHARGDTSGTEREQIVRLAEAYNQAIGAAMEFMEEGDVAKNVVKGFLAGALGTSTGQKLTEVAVRSRMDEAGVTGAPVGEKKKKLEEAGLLGLLELLLELGMNFTDKTIGAVVTEVQSATGGGR